MVSHKRKRKKGTPAKKATNKLVNRTKTVKVAKKVATPKRKVGRPSKAKATMHVEILKAVLPQTIEESPKKKVDALIRRYQKKRNFLITPEPSGGVYQVNQHPIFVIQKHNASKLHYDFRIELNGVLKSWAVPKGISLNLNDKRLAVATEDHPLEYANFEGTIPKGEYGAGTVSIWDRGYYENITYKPNQHQLKLPEKCLKDGHFQIHLQGRKIKGDYLLQRFKKGKQENWLMIKLK